MHVFPFDHHTMPAVIDFQSAWQGCRDSFHKWIEGSWAILFSHPADFTVCLDLAYHATQAMPMRLALTGNPFSAIMPEHANGGFESFCDLLDRAWTALPSCNGRAQSEEPDPATCWKCSISVSSTFGCQRRMSLADVLLAGIFDKIAQIQAWSCLRIEENQPNVCSCSQ